MQVVVRRACCAKRIEPSVSAKATVTAMSTNLPHDAEAILTFLPTQDGGRSTPVRSDYRPQFYYDGHDWDAAHTYPDVECVNPGNTVRVILSFLRPDAHLGRLQVGTAFLIREGRKIVGYGSISKLVDLEASANSAIARRSLG
jgi:translation elongation factor EF-Tu-like GTPase